MRWLLVIVNEQFTVATDAEVWHHDDKGLASLLRSKGLYKSLSLLLARGAGINIPPSLLLLAERTDLISRFAHNWGLPLMIRVDYSKRPKGKPIGGIPLNKLNVMFRVCKNLIDLAYMPLFHPNLDRFKDLYSSGVLLSRDRDEADVEVVGKAFDAGDLRLGIALPHETLRFDFGARRPRRLKLISDNIYERERNARAIYIRKLKAYYHFANQSGMLLSNLDRLKIRRVPSNARTAPPKQYEPMPDAVLRELLEAAREIQSTVLEGLPRSTVYVASFSYLANKGWVLWDVYGDWYRR